MFTKSMIISSITSTKTRMKETDDNDEFLVQMSSSIRLMDIARFDKVNFANQDSGVQVSSPVSKRNWLPKASVMKSLLQSSRLWSIIVSIVVYQIIVQRRAIKQAL